jgi:putative transposon-encoded protein
MMEEQTPSVKRNDWVLVEDVAVYEGLVVVVIGVTAMVRVPREDGAGDTYRAAEVRCCRPGSTRSS